MMGFIIVIHLIVCILLIGLILIQSGRGGGLVDAFSGVESMFGTKTNAFLTRTTTVLSSIFFITCLSLAFLSARQSRSLLRDVKTQEPLKAGEAMQVEIPQKEPEKDTAGVQQGPIEEKKAAEAPKTE